MGDIKRFIQLVAEKYEIEVDDLKAMWSKLTDSPSKGPCQYVFTRGKVKGTVCGVKGCSKHLTAGKAGTAGKTDTKQLVLRFNKFIDHFWHSPTKLVFRSENDKVVIGKCVGIGERSSIVPLDGEDIDTCRGIGFEYEDVKPEPKPVKKTKKVVKPEPKPVKKTKKVVESEPEPKPVKKTKKVVEAKSKTKSIEKQKVLESLGLADDTSLEEILNNSQAKTQAKTQAKVTPISKTSLEAVFGELIHTDEYLEEDE